MTTAQEYAIEASELFVLPDTSMRIKELIDDENASMQDISDIINYDPILAGQLLKLANSALYRFPNKVVNLDKALQVIGTASTYDLVVAYSVAKAFSKVEIEVEALERYWELSVSAAIIAKYVADNLGLRGSERLFVAGLLHNIGELVISQLNSEKAKACKAFSAKVSPCELQQEHLGFTYAELGAELIRCWGIPDKIGAPVRYQHRDERSANVKDNSVVQLACLMALENHYANLYASQSRLTPEYYEPLGLTLEDCKETLDFANMQSLSVLQMFSPTTFNVY